MDRKLILHAGLHKTGTTSIQKTCATNRKILQGENFVYPMINWDQSKGRSSAENHSRLISNLFEEGHKVAMFREEMAKIFGKDLIKKLLLVAELTSRLSKVELNDLKSYFEKLGYQIAVHCYIRKPVEWVNSLVAQKIAGQYGPLLPLDAAVNQLVHGKSLIRMRVNNLADVFEEFNVHSYKEAATHDSGVVGHFMDAIDLRSKAIKIAKPENIGKSDHSTRIISLINNMVGHRKKSPEAAKFHAFLREQVPALFEIPGERFHLRLQEAAELIPILEEDNQWLQTEYGELFANDEISFSDTPILLEDQAIEHLEKIAAEAGPRIKKIIAQYIDKHKV